MRILDDLRKNKEIELTTQDHEDVSALDDFFSPINQIEGLRKERNNHLAVRPLQLYCFFFERVGKISNRSLICP